MLAKSSKGLKCHIPSLQQNHLPLVCICYEIFFLKTGHVFVTFLLLLADKKWICQSKPQVKKLKSLFSSPGTYLALRIQITEYPQLCSLILKWISSAFETNMKNYSAHMEAPTRHLEHHNSFGSCFGKWMLVNSSYRCSKWDDKSTVFIMRRMCIYLGLMNRFVFLFYQ